MARVYVAAEALTAGSANTTSTYADQTSITIPAADADSSTWAIFFSSQHGHFTNTTAQSKARLYHSTASTVLSEGIITPTSNATRAWSPFSGVIPVTFGSLSGVDQVIKLQYANSTGAASVQMRDATIFAIKLGANDASNVSLGSSTSTTSTWVTKATFTAPANGTYDIFLGMGLSNSFTFFGTGFRILLEDNSTVIYNGLSANFFVVNTADTVSCAATVRRTLTTGQTVKVQFNNPSSAGTITSTYGHAVGFKTADFDATGEASDTTSRTRTSATYATRNAASDLTFTPGAATDHLLFGSIFDSGGVGAAHGTRAMMAGTQYGEATCITNSDGDHLFLGLRLYANMPAVSSTLSWEIKSDGSATVTSPIAKMGYWQLGVPPSPISVTAQIATLTLAGIAGTSTTSPAVVTAQPATLTLTALAGAFSGVLQAQRAELSLTAVAGTPDVGIPSTVPTTLVQMAFGADPLDPSPAWTDVTDWFRSVSGATVTRGRTSERDRYQGSMTLVLSNEDRRFDPSYTPGPYYGNLRPRTPVRVTASWAGVTYPLFRGFTSGFNQDYLPGGIAEVPIVCYDAFGVMANLPLGTYYDLHIKSKTPVARWPLGTIGGVWPEVAGKFIGYLDGDMRAQGDPVTIGDAPSQYLQPSTHFGGYSKGTTNGAVWSALGRPTTFTITGWFRTDKASPTVGSLRTIYNEASDASSHNARIGVDSTGALYYYGADFTPTAIAKARSTVLVNDGNWHQFTIVHDGLTRLEVYVDGADRTSLIEIEQGNILLTTPLAIGFKTGVNPDYPFIGDIAEVAIFDYAFTADEVAELYQAGAAPLDGDTTADHLEAILNALSWPSALTDLTTRGKECGPAPWAGTDALSLAQKIEDTEQGALFVSRDGKITLRDRYWWVNDTAGTTSQATFTDDWFAADVFYETFGFDYDDRFITNDVSVTINGSGTPVEYSDEASIAAYGVVPLSLTTLSRSAFEANDLAVFRVTRDKDPVLRSRPFSVIPQARPDDFWPAVLGLELGYRITLERSPQELGDAIVQDVVIDSIAWDISPGQWTLTLQGSQAFLLPDYWRLGTSQLGVDTVLGY